jgi:hypothetical protein
LSSTTIVFHGGEDVTGAANADWYTVNVNDTCTCDTRLSSAVFNPSAIGALTQAKCSALTALA